MIEHRTNYEYSAKRLRRARRLYFKLVSPYIMDGIEGQRQVRRIAAKLQERGFYSINTNPRNICFACYRRMFDATAPVHESWYEWLARRGYGYAPWFSKAA